MYVVSARYWSHDPLDVYEYVDNEERHGTSKADQRKRVDARQEELAEARHHMTNAASITRLNR